MRGLENLRGVEAVKSTPEQYAIADLMELRRANMLDVNQEYQRGTVWSVVQQQKLIDSLLRGYPIPLIYLHDIKKEVAGKKKENFEIIDGQQRLEAIYRFVEGAFSLLDPVQDEKKAKFPRFIKHKPCSWSRRTFAGLEEDTRQSFLASKLPVVLVETDDPNEVRDLFVRLQSGLPLNAQETRDSWPGEFTDFVLWLGGKPGIARYPGHAFFREVLGMKPGEDRGKTRQLAAQLAMVYLYRRENQSAEFPDISSAAISDFYYSHIDFERDGVEAKRLVAILDRLTTMLRDGKRPKLRGHDAIHLVALADALWDDYVPTWQDSLPEALDAFLHQLSAAKIGKDAEEPNEYWSRYAQWTRVNSDRGDRIQTRHVFYLEKMLPIIAPLAKDQQRAYGEAERTLLYLRNGKKCDVCGGKVLWAEAEVHHVDPHSKGGKTDLDNAALVHSGCHPKSDTAVEEFAVRFKQEKAKAREIEEALKSLDL
ncbi:DUF262 domain-containing protein [Mesorhizobium sp. VNQ89]|uniref:GmrSD restriction endonuclease domain-containing protein n=1 Tax=Mesorhizobium quangtriensis TaxID=3157709 RepID=UPI0032B7A1C7